jgi:lathosterol oxidase
LNEQRIGAFFGTERESRLGNGWWSGVVAVFCGGLALGSVLVLHYPQWLSSPELRAFYPMDIMRALIQALIWGALFFAVLSSLPGRNKRLASIARPRHGPTASGAAAMQASA